MRKGKVSYHSLVRSVLRLPFERREADHIGRDGAFFGSAGVSLNTTVYGGENAEALAFYRAYNGALAAGIAPAGAVLSLTLPTAETEEKLKRRMAAFQRAAAAEDVPILGGHTAFSDAVRVPILTVSVVGPRAADAPGEGAFRPEELYGRDLVLTKTAGEAGASVLLRERAEMLKKRLSAGFLEEAGKVGLHLSCRAETAVLREEGALLHDVSEGGLYAALWELAEGYQTGFFVDLGAVPLKQETVEICEILLGDPYSLLSTGAMLAAVPDGERAVKRLAERGVPAAVIGRIVPGRDKILKRGGDEGSMGRPGPDFLTELEDFG